MPPPLHGLRALDLTDALGHLCGRILVDLGVEVIKVEPPGGDPSRGLAPRYRAADGCQHGLYWYATNAGKQGVTLALGHPAAARVLADLTRHADFLLESSHPDAPEAELVVWTRWTCTSIPSSPAGGSSSGSSIPSGPRRPTKGTPSGSATRPGASGGPPPRSASTRRSCSARCSA